MYLVSVNKKKVLDKLNELVVYMNQRFNYP